MIGFKERLRTELVEYVEERRPERAPRRHRAWRFAVPVGVTAAAVIAALAVGTPQQERTVPTPMVINEVGYSIEVKPDGIVEINLVDPAGAKALERKLNELGIRAVVLISSADCAEPKPEVVPEDSLVVGFGSERNGIRIRPSVIPPDAYLMIVYGDAEDQFPNEGPAMFGIAAVKTRPGCFTLDRPASISTPR